MRFGRLAEMAASATLLLLSACGQGGAPGSNSAPGEAPPAITEEEIQAKAKAMLASLGAPATPEAQAQYAGEFELAGASEPDWSATLLPDYVLFSRPGLDEVNAIPSPRNVRAQGVYIEAPPLTIVVRAGQCTYGEGGESFPFSATVLFEGVSYEGCARQTANASHASSSWADALSQYLPAIDACLARVQAKPGRVTIAYPGEDGQTSVRLLESDGGRSECVVGADGTSVVSVEGLADRNTVRGERDPLFTRAPTAPPSGKCYASEPVNGSNGAVIGHLSRRTC